MKNNYPKTTRSFFTERSIFNYFKHLNRYNFGLILTKLVKLHFLETAILVSKNRQKYQVLMAT